MARLTATTSWGTEYEITTINYPAYEIVVFGNIGFLRTHHDGAIRVALLDSNRAKFRHSKIKSNGTKYLPSG